MVIVRAVGIEAGEDHIERWNARSRGGVRAVGIEVGGDHRTKAPEMGANRSAGGWDRDGRGSLQRARNGAGGRDRGERGSHHLAQKREAPGTGAVGWNRGRRGSLSPRSGGFRGRAGGSDRYGRRSRAVGSHRRMWSRRSGDRGAGKRDDKRLDRGCGLSDEGIWAGRSVRGVPLRSDDSSRYRRGSHPPCFVIA